MSEYTGSRSSIAIKGLEPGNAEGRASYMLRRGTVVFEMAVFARHLRNRPDSLAKVSPAFARKAVARALNSGAFGDGVDFVQAVAPTPLASGIAPKQIGQLGRGITLRHVNGENDPGYDQGALIDLANAVRPLRQHFSSLSRAINKVAKAHPEQAALLWRCMTPKNG